MAARKKTARKKAVKTTARPKLSELNALFKGTTFDTMDKAPEIVIVPSVFAGFNRASGCGGVALEVIHLIHGPTHEGKTALAVALGILSFVRLGHHTGYYDAEHAADVHGHFTNLGIDNARAGYKIPGFYEEISEETITMLDNIREGRDDGTFPPERAFSLVLDSLDMCIPEKVLKKIRKGELVRELDRERALYHGIYFSSITPLMRGLPFAFFALAHERSFKKTIKTPKGPKEITMWEVRGGKRIRGITRSQLRVIHRGYVTGSGPLKDVKMAKRLVVKVIKNKVGFPDAEFSFCVATEEGVANGEPWLNLGRELVEEAIHPDTAVMEIAGGRLKWRDKNLYKEQWVKKINADEELYAALWTQVAEAQKAHRERLSAKAG